MSLVDAPLWVILATVNEQLWENTEYPDVKNVRNKGQCRMRGLELTMKGC